VVEAKKPDEFLGRCPFGLERNPQGLDVILRRLDMPRGQIPTKLFFALLEGRTVGSQLETQVKILGYVKDVYGDKAGQLFPLAVHLKRRSSTKEDTRAKLSCTGDCDSCKLPGDHRLKTDIRTIRNLISLAGTGEEEPEYY
jgi:hypothetical protein